MSAGVEASEDRDAGAWHELGPSAALEEGRLHGRRVAGVRLCYGRSADGLFAVDDTCPHAGGSLTEGLLDGDLVICPLHAWAFETATGRCVDDPACSVSAYPIREEDGIVRVRIAPSSTRS